MKYATFFFALIITALIAACAFPGTASTADLKGDWTLATLNGNAPIAGTTITLSIDDSNAGGRSGCNHYGGTYNASGEKLTFPSMAVTEMYCMDPAGIMEQETAYLQALSQAASFSVDENRLEMRSASGETILVFTKN